jgi:hypothetical protein
MAVDVGVIGTYFKLIIQKFWGDLSKITKSLGHDRRYPCRYSILGSPLYEAVVLSTQAMLGCVNDDSERNFCGSYKVYVIKVYRII